jgi:hypothetical protein
MADHDLNANGTALYGTATYGGDQYGGHLQTQIELTPNVVLGQVLITSGLEVTTEVTTSIIVEMPPIGQVLRFTSFVAPESTLLLAG